MAAAQRLGRHLNQNPRHRARRRNPACCAACHPANRCPSCRRRVARRSPLPCRRANPARAVLPLPCRRATPAPVALPLPCRRATPAPVALPLRFRRAIPARVVPHPCRPASPEPAALPRRPAIRARAVPLPCRPAIPKPAALRHRSQPAIRARAALPRSRPAIPAPAGLRCLSQPAIRALRRPAPESTSDSSTRRPAASTKGRAQADPQVRLRHPRDGKPISIMQDNDDDEPVTGWVVERSANTLRMLVDDQLVVGSVYSIARPRTIPTPSGCRSASRAAIRKKQLRRDGPVH